MITFSERFFKGTNLKNKIETVTNELKLKKEKTNYRVKIEHI